MEFRSCPACKASVLEDDAVDCPFCGASMSGKPQAAAPKKPVAGKPSGTPAAGAKKSSPSVPAAKEPTRPGAGRPSPQPATAASGDKDDPFDIDTSALRRAIKLAPKPTKVRTLEVTCPMCETSGYLQPSDAGKDVHCCNPECMVPVFKSPKPKAAPAPVEEKKDNRLMLALGGGTVAMIAVALVWFFVLAEKTPEAVVTDDTPTDTRRIEDMGLTPDNKIVKTVDAPPATVAEIRAKSLVAMVERARQRDRNRSPEYGAQLAGEAFAEAGDLTKAREQIRRLQNTAAQAPYLQVQPLVEVGWRLLDAGNAKESQQTAATALTKVRNAPKSIRKTLDASTALAALLVANGNTAEAEDLIKKDLDRSSRGNLSVLWRASVDARTFQIDEEARRPWHLAMPEPMRVGVIESLVAHNQADAAWQFSATGEDIASQTACRAAWAGRVTQFDPGHALERVAGAIEQAKANPAAQCQLWSAVASMARQIKNEDLAKKALDNAVAASSKIAAPTILAVPNRKAIHDSEGKAFVGLPNPAPACVASIAWASLGVVQLENGQLEDAWKSFQQAIPYVRSMAPSAVVTQQLLDACDKQESTLRSQLNQELNLGGSDQRIRTAFTRYRRQVGKLHAEAQRRLALQVTILRFAASEGLLNETWKFALEQNQIADANLRDPYLETSLPSLIFSLAEANGNSVLAGNVKAAYSEKTLEVDPLDRTYAQASAAIAGKNFSEASDAIERAYRDKLGKKEPDRVDEIAFRICARAQSVTTPEAMIPFIKNLYDVVVQEDAFFQLAGYTMQTGTAPQFWKIATTARELDAIEHVSIFRGFIAGISASSASSTSLTPAPAGSK